MPFVPGIALTNAVRDIMTNHINSGMSKMFESLLVTLALGAGTSVALVTHDTNMTLTSIFIAGFS